MNEIYYKYRTTKNFKNFVDIILNNRLYAAKYVDLNDPMEGLYYYPNGRLNNKIRNKIKGEKQQLNICSLTKDPNNLLMWSHYADGHRGLVIGVKINDIKNPIEEIDYIDNLILIENYENMIAQKILTKKLKAWEYEKEVRVFSTNNKSYIDVKIEELIIGKKMDKTESDLIFKLVKQLNPEIKIKTQK